MKVSELAARAGIAPSAVRWYESQGILPFAPRRSNRYRDYGEEDLTRLQLVVSLRKLGVEPEDAGRIARSCLGPGDLDPALAPLIADQRVVIARLRDDLARLDAQLRDLEATFATAGPAKLPTQRSEGAS